MMDLMKPTAPLIAVEPRLTYPGLHIREGVCAFAHSLAVADKVIYALVVELEDNPSTSVTNAAEAVWTKVRQQLAPWLAPEGDRPYQLLLFESYEYRIRARRNAGQPDFRDPFSNTLRVGVHGAAEWGPVLPEHAAILEALTRALVSQGAICPEMSEAARTAP